MKATCQWRATVGSQQTEITRAQVQNFDHAEPLSHYPSVFHLAITKLLAKSDAIPLHQLLFHFKKNEDLMSVE